MTVLRPAPSVPCAPPARRASPEVAGKPVRPAARRPPPGPAAPPDTAFRRCLAAAPGPRPIPPRPAPHGERERTPAPGPANLSEPRTRDELPVEPFRVLPALFGGPERPAPGARPIDEALRLAGELIESMRVGRLGPGAHMVTLRLRRGEATVGVELVEQSGRLRLRLSGGADLGARLREALEAEGLDVEVDEA